MNGRYLFRGRVKSEMCWVCGWIIGDNVIISSYMYGTPEQHALIAKEYMGTGNDFFKEISFAYHVDPETISQCTGLRDKNRQLIFEGDIVQCDRFGGYVGEIIWSPTIFPSFEVRTKNNEIKTWCDVDRFVIIGNTYDNHELLEDAL